MKTFFTDLIAKSYINYTTENISEIAQFYYTEQLKVRESSNGGNIFSKKQFYNNLISNITALIDASYSKYEDNEEIDLSGIPPEFQEEYLLNTLYEKSEEQRELFSQYLEDRLYEKPIDWEKCNDAEKLQIAINNRFVIFKDPVSFIEPSDSIYIKTLVLRKSKLEYLKSEAERASKAKTIDELDEIDALIFLGKKSPSKPSDIENTVQKAFKFTLKIDPRKKKQILSEEDYLKLVNWVTYYFENKLELPEIISPIKELNTGKTIIRYAFKELIDLLNNKKPRPESFYDLIRGCFKDLSSDTTILIQKSSKPIGYDDLIK
ncbi:MAG TPA: hypothetical protein VIO43_05015 [Lutibacter sp.]